MPETELTHLKDKKQETPDKVQENLASASANKNNNENKSSDEKESMKNLNVKSVIVCLVLKVY